MPKIAYLDYNATAPTRPEVVEAATEAMRIGGNPSSVHGYGREARRLVEQARERVAALAKAAPGSVVFTSGGTEANNLALRACGRRTVLVSAVEHESVLSAADGAQTMAVSADGTLDLAAFESQLDAVDGTDAVVSLMAANNETGVIQPVREAAELARARGALVHCDAVQVAGRLDVGEIAAVVDMLSLSAHKLGGPPGSGALVLREDLEVGAIMRGGGQERSRRAGTENVSGIVGFGVAAELAVAELSQFEGVARLRDRLEAEAVAANASAVAFGQSARRLANTACLALPGVSAETQVMALDLAGIAVSSGAACSSGKVQPSHVLKAMGVPAELAACAIRVSMGLGTTDAEVDRFLEVWTGLSDRLGAAA